jgi:hypothetical protein
MTMTTVIHPQTDDQKNILEDFFKVAVGLELSENLLQIMKKELHYEDKATYPNGKGDPLTDLALLGSRPPKSLPTTIMEAPMTPAPTPTATVAVTKVEVKAPTLTQEVIDKFCKAGKMIGLSPETISAIEKELADKLEEGGESKIVEDAEPASEDAKAPAPKANPLAALLK